MDESGPQRDTFLAFDVETALSILKDVHWQLIETEGNGADATRAALAATRATRELEALLKTAPEGQRRPLDRGVHLVRQRLRQRRRRAMAQRARDRLKMFFGDAEQARAFTQREQDVARAVENLRRTIESDQD